MLENGSWEARNVMIACIEAANTWVREPFEKYGAKLFVDGNQWCALYGENIQEGVCGFGDSPAEAVTAFNAEWYSKWEALKEKDDDTER